MGMLVDGLVVLFLFAGCLAIRRGGAGPVLHRLVGLMFAYGAAALVAVVAWRVCGALVHNLWLRVLIVVVSGTIAGGGVLKWWRRDRLRRSARWQTWVEARGIASAIQVLAMVGWVGVNVLLLIMVMNIGAVASPRIGTWLRTKTWVGVLVLGPQARGAIPRDTHNPAAAQVPWWQRGIDGILTASGATRVMALVEALHWISTLSNEDLERIVATEPALQRIIDDPQLIAVLNDEHVMEVVHAAIGGSWSAIYAVGDEPKILALLESTSMRAAIAAVDPVAMQARLQAPLPRVTPPDRMAMIWQVRALASSLDMDAALASSEGWQNNSSNDPISFLAPTRYALVRAIFPRHSQPLRLEMRTSAALSCWIDTVLQRPSAVAGGQVVLFTRAGGELAEPQGLVVILFDFGGQGAAATTQEVGLEVTPQFTAGSATAYSPESALPAVPAADPAGTPESP